MLHFLHAIGEVAELVLVFLGTLSGLLTDFCIQIVTDLVDLRIVLVSMVMGTVL